jgi:hypothetical protein
LILILPRPEIMKFMMNGCSDFDAVGRCTKIAG